MEKTAVDWLIKELEEQKLIKIDKLSTIRFFKNYATTYELIVEQARKMEKEQIIEAFDEGQEYEYQYHINSAPKFDSETYYKETYGGNK